jgi:hypothetical protein
VQVGGAAIHGAAQEIINIDGHREHSPVKKLKPKLAWVLVPHKHARPGSF